MNNNEFVILTVKGWDGSRILGLFPSMSEANKVKDGFCKNETSPNDLHKEEFIFDIVRLGELSNACEIYMDSETLQNTTTRKHIYQTE